MSIQEIPLQISICTEEQEHNLIYWAASTGQHALLQESLSRSIEEINKPGPGGRSAVMEAALKGEQRSFELLLSAGADLSLEDEDGDSCLILAVQGGNEAIVRDLLSPARATVIDYQGQENQSAVMSAVLKGNLFMYKLLVAAGADLTLVDGEGNTCLHLATKGGNTAIITHLLNTDLFDINTRGHAGQTAVMMACFEGKGQVFDELVSKGADLSLVDDNENDCLTTAVFSGEHAMVKKVLETGEFVVNRRGEKGMTPAMIAASFGAKEEFDLLVSAGADLTLQNEFGNDFLFWASSGGSVDIVRNLLKMNKFDINRKQEHGLTALHIAITKGHLAIFELLTSEGADINLCNDQQYNSLMIAAHTGNHKIVKSILSMNRTNINDKEENGWTPVMIAAKNGNIEVFNELASVGADLMLLDKDLNSCLLLACIYNQPLMLEHLLKKKRYNINSRGVHSWTPVMVAANEGHEEVFDLLIAAGADVSMLDQRGNNCLILACMGGNPIIVKKLLKMDIFDLEHEGLDGTAVAAASDLQDGTILELLVAEGAQLRF